MNQKRLDELAEALRRQGLTWTQTNFAISLIRNEVAAERERCAQKAKHDADKVKELLRWKGIHAPRLAALEELYRASQLDAGAGREAAATLDSERKANAILTEEIEALRAANEAFGKRQEWWTERMFALEQKVKADEALHRQALDALLTREGDGADQWKADTIAALRERLERSGG